MLLENFRPTSKLVTKATLVERPKFPAIDAHNHLGAYGGNAIEISALDEVCDELDKAGITHYIDLDGGWGEAVLQRHLDYVAPRKERFQVFGGVDWAKWTELGNAFPEYAAKRLEVQKSWGAQGLKIWKPFGLHVRDHNGHLAKVDDPRLDPIWETAGRLGLPVLAHVADPVAFFDPIDATNERWEEIGANPDWAFTSPPFPPFLDILTAFKNLVIRHPSTTFIGAHGGCYGENLSWVGQMLDDCPNYYIDISARLGELGRQPYTARKFFIQYTDRILFGLDGGPNVDGYRLTYRFLETNDEYFNYSLGEIPGQGRWYVCGLYLPDDVLQKVYRDNAKKLLSL